MKNHIIVHPERRGHLSISLQETVLEVRSTVRSRFNLSFPLVEGKALEVEHVLQISPSSNICKKIEILLGFIRFPRIFGQNLAGFIGGSSDVLQNFHVSFCQMSPIFHHFIRSTSGKMLQTTSWDGPSQSQSYPIEVSTHLWTGWVRNKANIWRLSKIVVLQISPN